ncbi:hypothetical protein CJD36_004740 [Flavipsychrobacter stenotrophus]|uniref:Lipoprotein n=1 Tax=Flavipsychrobacter stenotrophus TaxID=2077091 RepID=A0A2S7T269_9BACT|nr:hypothetical protein [Flavipsychrobacter stenotrophus]PQJ13054.1 hypothetical protein CJD36_004740 [Flavipsychrobacter stenotrophus]
MKTKLIMIAALIGVMAFGSCKKDYTCTCTTVIGSASTTDAHQINDVTLPDAKNTCDNYETQANNSYPGGTTCHL